MLLKGAYRGGLADRYLTLFGGEALSKLCVLAAFAYLARTLGPFDFGLIELSLSVTIFFVMGVEAGLGPYGARVVATWPDRTSEILGRIIVLRCALGVVAYLPILYLSERYGMPGLGVLAIYGLTVLIVPFYNHWVFQGRGDMRLVAGATALRNLVFAACVFALIRPGSDIRLVAVSEVAGVLALAGFTTIALRRVAKVSVQWQGAGRGALRLLKNSWFTGASELMWAAMWYAPLILLGAWQPPWEVAWLAGPLRIVLALHTFVWLYFFNLLPRLASAIFRQGIPAWQELTNRSLSSSMWIACLLALGGTLMAPIIVTAIYGRSYESAALPLQVIIWMIPTAWLSGHFRYSLIASNHQRWEFVAGLVSALVTVTLCWYLIPQGGSVGGAIGLLGGGIANALLTAAAMERQVGSLQLLRALVGPIGTCVLCGAIGLWIDGFAGQLGGAALMLACYVAVALRSDAELTGLSVAWLRQS